jgi:hypothetical protein
METTTTHTQYTRKRGFPMSFKDRTFCASPNCKNKCGRKMSEKERAELDALNKTGLFYLSEVSYGYFCSEPKEEDECKAG